MAMDVECGFVAAAGSRCRNAVVIRSRSSPSRQTTNMGVGEVTVSAHGEASDQPTLDVGGSHHLLSSPLRCGYEALACGWGGASASGGSTKLTSNASAKERKRA